MSKNKEMNLIRVVGLAVALPGSILGSFLLVYYLIEEKLLHPLVGLILIVLVVCYTFYLMLRFNNQK